MFLLGLDGRFKKNLNFVQNIPGGMAQSPFTIVDNKIYTIGALPGEGKVRLKYFDGTQWKRY